jgi:hypothetical protein
MLALSAGILVLLVAPTVWAAIPIAQKSALVLAGPSQTRGFGGHSTNPALIRALIRYLETNQGHAKFLVATESSIEADGIILATNKPVMAWGGWSGTDPILTTSQLATLVANGTVRFFLLPTPGKKLPPQLLAQIPQATPPAWVEQHCTTVPAKLWQSTSTSSSTSFHLGGATQLYDCATTH